MDSELFVLEPQTPQAHHNFRKLLLRNRVCITVNYDTEEPMNLPLVTLSGPEKHTLALKESLNKNWENWDRNSSITQNLTNILEIEESMFIKRADGKNEVSLNHSSFTQLFDDDNDENRAEENSDDIIGNSKCQICLSLYFKTDCQENDSSSDDEDSSYDFTIPEVFCQNVSCLKQFHTACISKWFKAYPGVTRVFQTMIGPCPACKAKISIDL